MNTMKALVGIIGMLCILIGAAIGLYIRFLPLDTPNRAYAEIYLMIQYPGPTLAAFGFLLIGIGCLAYSGIVKS